MGLNISKARKTRRQGSQAGKEEHFIFKYNVIPVSRSIFVSVALPLFGLGPWTDSTRFMQEYISS